MKITSNSEKGIFNNIYKRLGGKYFVNDGLIKRLGFKKINRLGRPKFVLEIGCGVGRHSLELARLGYQVTGIDISKEGIDWAKRKAKAENLKVNLLCGNALTVDFARKSYDVIIFIDSLHHFYYRGFNKIIFLVAKLLKTNGSLFIVEPNHFYPYNYLSFGFNQSYLRYFKWLGFGNLRNTITKNERSLNPDQLITELKNNYILSSLCFYSYGKLLSQKICIRRAWVLEKLFRLTDWLAKFLPEKYQSDHFIMKLIKK